MFKGELYGSSVCPVGYRVPIRGELGEGLFDTGSAEIENRDDAFNGFLKFPSAGHRSNGNRAGGFTVRCLRD